MCRYAVLIGVAAVSGLAALTAQELRFEAVSIKRSSTAASQTGGGASPGGRYTMTNGPVRRLLVSAYSPENPEIVGAPGWIDSERYDVSATANRTSSRAEIDAMLRTMLADRFALRGHIEMRDAAVFVLVRAHADGTLGPQLRASRLECTAAAAARRDGRPMPAVSGTPSNGAPPCGLAGQAFGILGGGVTMTDLAGILKGFSRRMVVDRTDLEGFYEFELNFTPEVARTATTSEAVALPTALREQLGLELKPDRLALRTLVIDSIERPTPN